MLDAGKIVCGCGSAGEAISRERVRAMLEESLAAWGDVRRVLILPPDFTRFHSGAGEITALLYEILSASKTDVDIMPALGTHLPMSAKEISVMFPGIPANRFLVHNWRTDTKRLGEVPSAFVHEISDGRLDYSIHVEVNRALIEGNYDLILSVGQVVPHEVAGLANHNKNICVGVGGADMLNKSHFLGAVYGMERLMGRGESPVRQVFDYAEEKFLSRLPIKYLLTVKSLDSDGELRLRGLMIGEGKAPFDTAAKLSRQVNVDLQDRPIRKALVWLDPAEFKSTWLGNKAVYRLRMAMADDGELIILAPGVRMFGEDPRIDELIRKYGYHGTPHTLGLVKAHADLRENLSVAAHLIHGSSEGRFRVTYAARGLTRDEIEGAGFAYADPEKIQDAYKVKRLRRGWNEVNGEEVFYVDNPALGLWAVREKFLEG